tara:strand:+ start:583 stop:2340 length:1758 start_codon:yes stop_codon:yes gene_type:complete
MFIKKIINLTNYTDKKSILILFSIIFFAMIIETLSIGLIIPAIAFVTDENFYNKYSSVVSFFSNISPVDFSNNNSGLDSKKINFIIPGLFFILLVYFFKAILLSFINLYQIKFTKNLELKLSNELFKTYLNQPYTFHLNRNSSVLLRNIDECNTIANGVYSLIILLSEILVLIGITILLLIFATTSAIFAAIFILISISFFYFLTKDYLLKWGKERHELMYLVIKQLQQGFQGIKDIKILGRQDFFASEFKSNKTKYYSKLFKSEFIKSLPKLWLEFMIISVLVGITLLLLLKNTELNKIFFSLGVFAAAAFRILPSINRIINCLQNLKNNLPSIENINNEISLNSINLKKTEGKKFQFRSNEIIIKNLNYKYPESQKTSLTDISLEIKKGQTIGIVGESGSGKSTLLDIMLGLLPTKNKEVSIFGNNLKDVVDSWQKEIGYVSQNIYLTDDSIKKNIALGIKDKEIDEKALKNSIKLAQLDDFVLRSQNGIDSIVGERGARISGGEKQRVGIARALYRNPPVLVLDEATSALDLKNEEEIIKTISKLKGQKTILIVSHRPSTVQICDVIFVLEKGYLKKIDRKN